jgi:hypothetical protein
VNGFHLEERVVFVREEFKEESPRPLRLGGTRLSGPRFGGTCLSGPPGPLNYV